MIDAVWKEIQRHGLVIMVSVVLALVAKWMPLTVILVGLVGAVIAFWARGWRITLIKDETNKEE